MSRPRWTVKNLQQHFDKRRREHGCWKEILHPESMTKENFEAESYRAYDTAILEYEAIYKRHGHAVYHLDKRRVVSIASGDKKNMITCFHKHYLHAPHQPGSATPTIENILEYTDDMEASLDAEYGEIEAIFRVELLNVSKSQSHKSPLAQRVKRLRTKCRNKE